jgi:lysophospholipase L1-like esterase
MMCRVATAGGATWVELVSAFNGPNGSQDAGQLLGPDHLHPSEPGHLLIADAISKAGFAPLR